MSYQNWACYGWLLPATFENAKLLGISDEDIIKMEEDFGKPEEGESRRDWWDNICTEMSYDSVRFTGHGKTGEFSIELIHIGEEDEIDTEMDGNVFEYFSFYFDELYTPTPLYSYLQKLGMKYGSWVSGG